ncbi:MAG TPA: hypothetical protein VFJ16_07145 [Longimicrobium sp.]|nr:hypothetical protein [Longimicrobium sp.]
MNNADLPLAEVTENAIHLLAREMGVVNTIRFLNQFVTGKGNYTQERDALFQGLSLDEILSDIRHSAGRERA